MKCVAVLIFNNVIIPKFVYNLKSELSQKIYDKIQNYNMCYNFCKNVIKERQK